MPHFKKVPLTLAYIMLLGCPVTREAGAGVISVSYSAVGDANPALVVAPIGSVRQNGDFTVQSCCGDPVIFNASEEYVSWTHDLSDAPEWDLADPFSVMSADLTLTWRTGGDTPNDDELWLNGTVATPFGFASSFSQYSRTFDLLALYGESTVSNALAFGELQFRTSNDSLPYNSTLGITTSAVPEPKSAVIVGLAVTLLVAVKRLGSRRARADGTDNGGEVFAQQLRESVEGLDRNDLHFKNVRSGATASRDATVSA